MAAIDFPASPTLNQTFTAPNGVIYQWDSVKWVIAFAPAGMVALKTNAPNGMTLSNYGTFTASWSSIDFNNGGGLWDGTLYTVKTAGLYAVDFQFGCGWPAAGSVYITQGESYIKINGTTVVITSISHGAWQGPLWVTYPVHLLASLNVNDTIGFAFFVGNGVPSYGSTKNYTQASIVRLGS